MKNGTQRRRCWRDAPENLVVFSEAGFSPGLQFCIHLMNRRYLSLENPGSAGVTAEPTTIIIIHEET